MPRSGPTETEALLQRAQALLGVHPAGAIQLLEQALESDPGHPKAVAALAALAEGYQSLKRFHECGFLLESCIELEPRELQYHVRLCAFRLSRAHYLRAAQGVQRYREAGGTPAQMERLLQDQRQHPRAVIRALRALCDALQRVPLARLPHFKSMGEIVAFEEQMHTAERPERGEPVSTLPGVAPEAIVLLEGNGLGTVGLLASATASDLVALGFKQPEAEILLDVANAQIYLANAQANGPR